LAAGVEHGEVRPVLQDLADEVGAVEAGQFDIGEDQDDLGVGVERGQGGRGVLGCDDVIAE